MIDRSESASIEVERLRASLDKAITARDQVELEAGRLAKELEKSQMLITKNAEAMESSKKEHERILAEAALLREERDAVRQELRRAQQHQQMQGNEEVVRLQHDLQVAQRDRDKMAAILENREKHAEKIEKAKEKLEAEAKQLQVERDQLVIQLEKSQDMLMNFQHELNASEAEGEKQREELHRLQQLQQQRGQQPSAESMAEVQRATQQVQTLTNQVQALTQNLTRERQRAEQAEKRLQESLSQHQQQQPQSQQQQQQIEQWQKQLEMEKQRAEAAEKRVQLAERQLHAQQQQIQQMQQQMQQQQGQQGQQGQNAAELQRLQKELQKSKDEVNQAVVERERFQAQIEMLCQELQQNQVSIWKACSYTFLQFAIFSSNLLFPFKVALHEARQSGAAKAGDMNQERAQIDNQRRQLDQQRQQTEEKAKNVDVKARSVDDKERALQNLDQELKKRKAKLDQLEQQLQKVWIDIFQSSFI